MSKQAKRFAPVARVRVRESLTERELAAEVTEAREVWVRGGATFVVATGARP